MDAIDVGSKARGATRERTALRRSCASPLSDDARSRSTSRLSSSRSSSSDFTRDVCTGDDDVGFGEGTAKSFESATAANALFRDRGRSPLLEPFCDGGLSLFNRPSIFVSVFWIVSETSESLAETAAASLLRVRDLRGHQRE